MFFCLNMQYLNFELCLQVLDFVSRYLPAYKAYLPTLYSEGPKGLDPDRLVVIDIDEERNPLSED